MSEPMNTAEIARRLRRAPRHGAELDEPEGPRYVEISDTLMNQLTQFFELYAGDDPKEILQTVHALAFRLDCQPGEVYQRVIDLLEKK